MRRILVENARRKRRSKYGGDKLRVALDYADLAIEEPSDDLVALDDALAEKTLFTRYAHIIGTPACISPEQAELSDLDVRI